MKKIFAILCCTCLLSFAGFAQQEKEQVIKPSADSSFIAEAACGECQFKMAGTSCDLAVSINGQAYFVDGSNIDDHGDAHANDGFCKKIRQANVTGHVTNGRFVASKFVLLPQKKENE